MAARKREAKEKREHDLRVIREQNASGAVDDRPPLRRRQTAPQVRSGTDEMNQNLNADNGEIMRSQNRVTQQVQRGRKTRTFGQSGFGL